MIERTLLDPATVPAGRRHPMPVETQQPPEAAYRAEAELLAVLGEPPRLDVCVLGIGPDGHTASLFPGAAQLASDRWIVDAPAGWEPYVHRVTMTFKTINEARACIFLVPDGSKADVVARALAADGDVSEAPARGVQPRDGELVWLLTAAAARGLAA
jgi:6-phosphogluconolactonase